MAKLKIGKNTYSKSALGAKWSEVISQNPLGAPITGEDFLFIDACVSKVPKWKKILDRGSTYSYKIGSKKFRNKKVLGIILITPNTAREVWIGKGQLLSGLFPKAPQPPAETNKAKVLVALRQIIQPQIDLYRRAITRQIKSGLRYKVRCAITKEVLNFGDFHIDHKYPFKNIVEDWCKRYGFDLETIEVYTKGCKCYLKNTEIAESFFDYHLLNAILQPTTAKANLSKGSKFI